MTRTTFLLLREINRFHRKVNTVSTLIRYTCKTFHFPLGFSAWIFWQPGKKYCILRFDKPFEKDVLWFEVCIYIFRLNNYQKRRDIFRFENSHGHAKNSCGCCKLWGTLDWAPKKRQHFFISLNATVILEVLLYFKLEMFFLNKNISCLCF